MATKNTGLTASENGRQPTRELKLSNGAVFNVVTPNALWVERLFSAEPGKPQVPMVEVKYAKGKTGEEPNPRDEVYLAELAEWSKNINVQRVKVLFSWAVKDKIPAEFRARADLQFFAGADDLEWLYLWVVEKMGGDEEELMGEMTEGIMSMAVATPEAVADAQNGFRDED